MTYDTATPYIASYVLLRCKGKIAFVLRSNTSWMNGYYGLPSGKIEKGESFMAGAIRETKEEVGITITAQNLRHALTMHRQEPNQTMSWVDLYFEVDYWEGEPVNAEPHMHSELAWLDPKALPENVIPAVAAALEAIEAGKVYAEYGWA
jgi:8-oxo-dGTP pyrophosphatase MutT (NUDIX family)